MAKQQSMILLKSEMNKTFRPKRSEINKKMSRHIRRTIANVSEHPNVWIHLYDQNQEKEQITRQTIEKVKELKIEMVVISGYVNRKREELAMKIIQETGAIVVLNSSTKQPYPHTLQNENPRLILLQQTSEVIYENRHLANFVKQMYETDKIHDPNQKVCVCVNSVISNISSTDGSNPKELMWKNT